MASRTFVAQHGMNSHTPAVQHLIRTAVGAMVTGGTRRKKKMSSRVSSNPRRRRKARTGAKRSGRPARLVKGSAAAKRYMAKIRRKRGK